MAPKQQDTTVDALSQSDFQSLLQEQVRMAGRLTLVTILSGSLIFLSDLIRCLPLRMKLGLITVSSYKGTKPTTASVLGQLNTNVTGRHVLLVDDILDNANDVGMENLSREEKNQLERASRILNKEKDNKQGT